MKDKGLFVFYLIFWVCGRFYMLADSYYLVKVYHSIGLHFDIICLVSYICMVSKTGYKKLFWLAFLFYEILGSFVYFSTQLSIDQAKAAESWAMGLKSSAPNMLYGNIGSIQDFFIPVYVLFVAFFINKRAGVN